MNKDFENLNLAKPWYRFFARTLDLYIGIMVIGFLAELTLGKSSVCYVNLMNTPNNGYAVGIIFMPFALLLDALICNIFGTNLGKYIFGIHIVKETNEPTFKDWIRRNLGVWISGYAIGFPLVSLLTMHNQKKRVESNKQSSYDEKLGFNVYGDELSKFKKIRAFTVLILVYLVLFGLQFIDKQKESEITKSQHSASYSWQNPITNAISIINPVWKFEPTKNEDGQSVYIFNEVTDHAVVIFAMETGELKLNQYLDAFLKANSKTMSFNDGGKFTEVNGINTWTGVGTMLTAPESRLNVEVRKIGNDFWRVLSIQAKPYEYSDKTVDSLKSSLWGTVQKF